MGIIYDVMRKEHHDEDDYKTPIENHNLIPFSDFIEVLELYTDDELRVISEYLINEDEFLKLNFYYPYGNVILDKNYIGYNLAPLKYDCHKDKDDIPYPTENFLEDILLGNGTDEYENKYCWKAEDLLSLECMVKLGLDTSTFKLCHKAMYGNARMLIEYHKKNEVLSDRLKKLENDTKSNEVINLLDRLKIANTTINEQKKDISNLIVKIESLDEGSVTNNDREMHPRTANNASKIIAALTSELLKMDITKPYSNDSNGKIKAAIERQGHTVSKDVIGYWLDLAHKNSI